MNLPLFRPIQLFAVVLFFLSATLRAEEWTTLKNSELVPNSYLDGDSFHIHSGSKEMIVRLYFVDAPETANDFPDRVKTQGDYFGLGTRETLALGKKAAEFTRKTLGKRFTVVTRHEDARGNSAEPRYYGFILLENDKTDFADLLVSNGLARVFGAAANRPGGLDTNAEWQQLRKLEAAAKTNKTGGWSKLSADPTPKTLAAVPTDSAKLDLNSATEEQLESLPKIGKVLAARIVAARPFATVDDLLKIPGIKQAAFTAISPLVEVRPP